MKEAQIKARLIDAILESQGGDTVIACEVPFNDGRRRADVVSIGDLVTAYEIKGVFDNLDKLSDQLVDYLRCFECVVVVASKRHLKGVLAKAARSVGVIVFDEAGFKIVRKPVRRRALQKKYLSNLISREDLVGWLVKEKGRRRLDKKVGIAKLRAEATSLAKLDELKILAYTGLAKKYGHRFNTFMKNRGEVTHPEDLYFLIDSPNEFV